MKRNGNETVNYTHLYSSGSRPRWPKKFSKCSGSYSCRLSVCTAATDGNRLSRLGALRPTSDRLLIIGRPRNSSDDDSTAVDAETVATIAVDDSLCLRGGTAGGVVRGGGGGGGGGCPWAVVMDCEHLGPCDTEDLTGEADERGETPSSAASLFSSSIELPVSPCAFKKKKTRISLHFYDYS